MIIVGRSINGITVNGLEYLLDDDGNVMEFKSEEAAKDYLRKFGYTDDEFEWMSFINEKEEN